MSVLLFVVQKKRRPKMESFNSVHYNQPSWSFGSFHGLCVCFFSTVSLCYVNLRNFSGAFFCIGCVASGRNRVALLKVRRHTQGQPIYYFQYRPRDHFFSTFLYRISLLSRQYGSGLPSRKRCLFTMKINTIFEVEIRNCWIYSAIGRNHFFTDLYVFIRTKETCMIQMEY